MKLVRLRSAYNLNDNKFIPMSPTKIAKKSDKPLLGQLLELISSSVLNKAIGKHHADKHCHKYKIYDQLVAYDAPQLNKYHALREIAQGISISPKILCRYWPGA